jgi:predicted YcjX-like family ATPase
MEPGKIVYSNNGFKIIEYPTERYVDHPILSNEKIYHIRVDGENRPTFTDICEALFYLLKNKEYDGAFEQYKHQVNETLFRAEIERTERKNGLVELSKNINNEREKLKNLSNWM